MFKVEIDELVFERDFKRIDKANQKRIIKTIRRKLTTKPKEFGKPLAGDLKGYWKLRGRKYRVIYEIIEEKVLVYVIMVGYRRDEEIYKKIISCSGLE